MQETKGKKLALLEAALFVTEKPLSSEELKRFLKVSGEELNRLLSELKRRYERNDSGIELLELNGYKLAVKSAYSQQVARFTRHAELSRGLLRALSLIAYFEPLKQSDLVRAIGNRAYEYVRELERMGFVRSEKFSRTKLLRTTRHFKEYFGVKSKEELRDVIKANIKS